jgi:kynurenine formamidase
MCDACVMDAVRDRMLSRRSFFKVSAGAGAAVAAASTVAVAPRAFAQTPTQMADMTHTLTTDFPTFFGEQQFFMEQKFNWAEHKFNLFELRVNEHTGTHVDAPFHFSADGLSVDMIPVDRLFCPLAVIDIREKAAADADAQVTPDDIKAWIAANGDIPAGACVAMNSGWSAKVATPAFRNADGEGKMHFPGFHVEAAQMLAETGDVAGIAVDTLSLDHGISPDFATHYAWLPTGRWGLECLANLDAVPATGATLIVGAPKHAGGSGGPARVFTMF